MTVTPQDVYEMARLKAILDGGPMPAPPMGMNNLAEGQEPVILERGASKKDIAAMSDILTKLHNITDDVTDDLITESARNTEVQTAMTTSVNSTGVKVGQYQIDRCEDPNRIAGKQYYNIYHIRSGDIIAEQVTLYETALTVVKLLNSGAYVNNPQVSRLFEYDNNYAGHKIDALGYKRKVKAAERKNLFEKIDLYEARFQASMQRAMECKQNIRSISENI